MASDGSNSPVWHCSKDTGVDVSAAVAVVLLVIAAVDGVNDAAELPTAVDVGYESVADGVVVVVVAAAATATAQMMVRLPMQLD